MHSMSIDLEKPQLYELAPEGGTLRLLAARCSACGVLTFPAASYGCRGCGAAPDGLTRETLSGRGILREFITVHLELVPGLKAPAVIGDVEIADGLVEEVMMGCAEGDLALGMVVQAVPVEIGGGEERRLACRFVPEGAAP